MTVIDASTIAKYVLKEENWEQVEGVLDENLYSLTLAIAEVSNAIWKHHVLYSRLSDEEARLAFVILKKLCTDVIQVEEFQKHVDDAMKIAISENITIYDALYLVQANSHGELISSDKKQSEIAKKIGIHSIFIE